MIPYFSSEFLNTEQMNLIETNLDELTDRLRLINNSLPDYIPKTWNDDEYLCINFIENIERQLIEIADEFPINIDTREIWAEQSPQSFTITNDYNRWIRDLNLIINYIDEYNHHENRYSGESYSNERIWL